MALSSAGAAADAAGALAGAGALVLDTTRMSGCVAVHKASSASAGRPVARNWSISS